MDRPTRDFFSTEIIQSTNINDKDKELRRLVEYVVGLKTERRKIEAFKRELPLCLDLLNDALEMFEVELRKGRGGVECNFCEVGGLNLENNDFEDMKNWMSSVQLWNYHDHNDSHHLKSVTVKGSAMEITKRSDDQLSLRHPVVTPSVELSYSSGENVALNKGNVLVNKQTVQKKFQRRCWSPQQVCRKQRRRWSHELHQRFVDALQQLGGSEVATPKQIRDIMGVKGLTNGEVKSHLQKYRLHVRKTSPLSPLSSSPYASQDDVHLLKLKTKSHSVSPQGPLEMSAGSVDRCSVSNGTTFIDEDDEEETEDHSWGNHSRVIYRLTMPTC